jgi:predicted Rossmann fold flavoprotein
MRSCDVLIIGAGAAGMMCAVEAGKRKRKVILVDHSEKIGRNILISGGGRCNFTNINTTANSFVSQNPHFCKSALARYTPQDFISLVKEHGIKFHEKKLGQLFCDNSAQEVVDLLVGECEKAGNGFQLGCKVNAIKKDDHFVVDTNKETYECQSVVIATGGLSIPQIGATGFGYDIARQFGLAIVETAPALDGFNFKKEDLAHFAALTGVSIDTIVSCNGAAFRENILFTHTGLSGPASLQSSLYWKKPMPLKIDLLPDVDVSDFLHRMRKEKTKNLIKNVLAEVLPKRFAEEFCGYYRLTGNLSEMADKRLAELAETLKGWQIFPDGTVGYKKAEVTRGGVSTNELSSQSMESKKIPGLYFIGEVVDVTGQLGGYNFQWAWASGFAAGQYA